VRHGGLILMRADFLAELDFIQLRSKFLQTRPRDTDGVLMCRDDRDEAGMLVRLVEELEREYEHSQKMGPGGVN